MKDMSHLPALVTGLAFLLATVFGAVATRVNFCTMGAISDAVNFGDKRRLRMWLLAIAVAIAGAAALQIAGLVDLSKTLYTGNRVSWLSLAVGGFLFGFGMTLGSGCGSKSLIRVGGGNLKSLIVLVFFAISAYMTLKGLFALWRTMALDPLRFDVAALGAKTSDVPTILAALGAGDAIKLWFPFAFAAAIAGWVLADGEFRATREMVVGGIVIGAVIVGGWYVSGHIGYLPEDPATLEEKFVATNSGRAESFSYTAPLAYSAGAPHLLDRPVARADVRHRRRAGHARRLGGDGDRDQDVPLGGLHDDGGSRQSCRRRNPDGLRRRHRAGVYDRAGTLRRIDAGAWLVPRGGRDRRRLRGGAQVPDVAAG